MRRKKTLPIEERRSEVQKEFEKIIGGERTTTSDLLGLLFAYAKESRHITEIGVANPCTTYALAHALEVQGGGRLIGIDIQNGFPGAITLVADRCQAVGIEYRFIEIDSLALPRDEIEYTDFLFVDSLHVRDHLLKELDLYSPKVKSRIAFHDTEYPCELYPFVAEWLETPAGSVWREIAHYRLSHGLTIIERRIS